MKSLYLQHFWKSASLLATLLFANMLPVCAAPVESTPVPARLTQNGKALMTVTVVEGASEPVKTAAATLAEYLSRISGGEFKVQNGDGKTGLAVGAAADFPALALQRTFDVKDAAQQEAYLLRSHANGVYLVGATELGVEHAVWDFLHRLGYRQFFPGDHWEVVPSTPDLSIAVNEKEQPDYYTRRIWFTYSTWPNNQKRVTQWSKKNRMGGLWMNFGHAYGGIIARNKAEFDKHPEYFALVGGKRRVGSQGKFDISNPGLRQLVIDDALRYFEQNPDAASISVDPSDGGNWGDTEAERKIGSVSDRVTYLANEVAEAVNKKYPGKYIGFYAYNYHSPPPSIRVHPNVAVSVATAFIKGGYTRDELIQQWQKQGAKIGIREYYSIPKWDKDMPRRARASNIQFITRSLPETHQLGARFMSAESSDNWAPHGLGYYLASRLMWDVDEAGQAEQIIDDFLEKSFGPAKEPMKRFYGLITTGVSFSAPLQPVEEPLVASMYRELQTALEKTDDPQIMARIGDLVTYTRFIELYRAYLATSPGDERLAAFEKHMRHSYRTHPTHMVHSIAQYRGRYGDRTFKVPAEAHWQQPEETNPWKSSEPFSMAEIRQMVKDGVANNKPLDFEIVEFSRDLVPATPLKLETPGGRGKLNMSRGTQSFLVWIPEGAGGVTVEGLAFPDHGPASLELYRVVPDETVIEAEDDEEEVDPEAPPEIDRPQAVDTAEVPPEHKYLPVRLTSPHSGLHRIQIKKGLLEWAEGTPVTVESSLSVPRELAKRARMYFYVPKGTKVLGVYAKNFGQVRSPSGKVVLEMDITHADGPKGQGYIAIPVEPGEDGNLWTVENAVGELRLITVPPYMARNAEELLLPREVVEADTLK